MAKRRGVTPGEFGSLLRDLVERSMELASVSEALPLSEHPNLQVAIEEYVASKGSDATPGGIRTTNRRGSPRCSPAAPRRVRSSTRTSRSTAAR
jgi:hypothetical protein